MTKKTHVSVAILAALLLLALIAAKPAGLSANSPDDASSRHATAVSTEESALQLAASELRVAGYTVKAHHYNLCSSVCFDRKQATVNIANYMFHEDAAWTLSVNEACWLDIANMDNNSTRISGFSWVTAKEYEPNCAGPYGNAILYIGNRLGTESDVGRHQYARQCTGPSSNCSDVVNNCSISPGGQECRTMVCMRYDVYGLVQATCTTHLTSGKDAVAIEQARDYEYLGSVYAGSLFKYFAGDFNINPGQVQSATSRYMNLYKDGTTNNTYHTRTGLVEKIDYIWVQGGVPVTVNGALCTGAFVSRSDHCYTTTVF